MPKLSTRRARKLRGLILAGQHDGAYLWGADLIVRRPSSITTHPAYHRALVATAPRFR